MTTPERLRRRQRVEGACLVVLGIVTLSYGIWDSAEARDRDRCMAANFRQASEVANTRATLAQQSSEITLRSDNLQEQVIEDVASAQGDREKIRLAFEEYYVLDAELDKEQAELLETRKNTKVPDFPTGTCE